MTAALVGENLGDEQPLIELAAFFGALLHQRPLGVDLLARRQQRRIAGRRRLRPARRRAASARLDPSPHHRSRRRDAGRTAP